MKQVIVIGVLVVAGGINRFSGKRSGESTMPKAKVAPAAARMPTASRRFIVAAAEEGLVRSTRNILPVVLHQHFAYHQTMHVEAHHFDTDPHEDIAASRIAAAIGEPARARMLYCLIDGRARTSTELAVVADVTPSTASVHLHRLKTQRLVKVFAQGKHRYYSLEGANVATVLEALSVLAGGSCGAFVPNTPSRLRAARTCYDHIAGSVGVLLHDRFRSLRWLSTSTGGDDTYDLTSNGVKAFEALGIDIEATRALRRRFAWPCLDWSERRPHVGGALGAALLKVALKRKWLLQDLDTRVLTVTSLGRREMLARFGLSV
jgi:DNA-binding transcriptional ArsR family regulator